MSTAEALRARAEDAEQEASRLRDMAEFAEKLGEAGVAEFVALIATNEVEGNGKATNGRVNGHKREEKIPRGREAVRLIVGERPGIWTLKQVRAEMELRGWFTSRKGVEVAASRLCSDGEGKRIGRGRYLFPAENEHLRDEEVERESNPSDGALIPFET